MIKVNDAFIDETSAKAKKSPRLRMNYNFHKEDAATLQRMLNAIEPGTYTRPHKHENPDKVEAFFVLRGKMAVLEYSESGELVDFIILDPENGNYGAEIAPGVWHNIVSLQSGSVAYEVKDGPYDPTTDKIFAEWAPEEGAPEAEEYLNCLLKKINC